MRKPADQVEGGLAARVGDRNLDVDVLAPGRDEPGLPLHLVELVGEHLERDRTVGDGGENVARESCVIGDSGLAHQRGVGGEAL